MTIDTTCTVETDYDTLQRLIESWGALCTNFSIFKDCGHTPATAGTIWRIKTPNVQSTKPVVEGKIILYTDYWRVTSSEVYSEVLTNPTWKDLVLAVDKILVESKNYLYLEGLYVKDSKVDGAQVVEILFGS